jgi:hypothetical protein
MITNRSHLENNHEACSGASWAVSALASWGYRVAFNGGEGNVNKPAMNPMQCNTLVNATDSAGTRP